MQGLEVVDGPRRSSAASAGSALDAGEDGPPGGVAIGPGGVLRADVVGGPVDRVQVHRRLEGRQVRSEALMDVDGRVGDGVDEVGPPVPLLALGIERVEGALQPGVRHRGDAVQQRLRQGVQQRRHGRTGVFLVTDVGPDHGTDRPQLELFGERRGRWHLGVREEAVQRPRGVREELPVGLQHGVALADVPEGGSADEPGDVVQPEGERGDHAEVAAAAAEGPEQVRFLGRARPHLAAVGQHDLRREQVVDGQSVRPRQMTESTTEGQAADTGGGEDAARGGEPVGAGGGVHLAPGAAATDPYGPECGIHLDRVECREVDDQSVVAGAETATVVTAAAHGEQHTVLARGVDAGDHVGHGVHLDDEGGGLVDHGVVDALRRVVAGIGGAERRPGEVSQCRLQGGGGGHRVLLLELSGRPSLHLSP